MFLDLVATLNTEHSLCAVQVFSHLTIPTASACRYHYLSPPFYAVGERGLVREAKLSHEPAVGQTPAPHCEFYSPFWVASPQPNWEAEGCCGPTSYALGLHFVKALFCWFFRLSVGLAASPLKGSPNVYLSQKGRLLAQCLTADSSQNWSENSQPECSGPVSLRECSWQRQFMFRLDCLVGTGHLCPIISSVEALILQSPFKTEGGCGCLLDDGQRVVIFFQIACLPVHWRR